MRAFVAIDIPEDIRRRIADLVDALKPAGSRVRWSRTEGLHITLKFFGQVPDEKIPRIIERLTQAQTPQPFPLAVRDVGYFPNQRSPRIIWLGIEPSSELSHLAVTVDEATSEMGIPLETRPFSAHLTLGRLENPERLIAMEEILKKREPLEFGAFNATEFFLYESQLSRGGSIYKKVARFPIAEPANGPGKTAIPGDREPR